MSGVTGGSCTAEIDFWRGRFVGYVLAVFMVCAAVSAFAPPATARLMLAFAGVCGWVAALMLWRSLSTGLRLMSAMLIVTGLAAGAASGASWVSLIERSLSQNVGILFMLFAVGFLRLVPLGHANEKPVTGFSGWWQTLFSTALFGSVINISALLIIADYIRARGGGGVFALQSLTRVFTASAAWSPFFAGMAVVLEYVPGANLLHLMAAALPFAVTAMLLTWAYGRLVRQADLVDFVGFPLQLRALALPTALAGLVVSLFFLMPGLPIVVVIALSALLTCCLFLSRAVGVARASRKLRDHVETGLTKGVNELALFLAAGVLSVGLGALFESGVWEMPVVEYDWFVACIALAVMVGLAVAGVHPVVSVSGLAPALLTLSPPPVLIAMTFLFAWSLGTSVSPLSATMLTVQSRYGVPGWRMAAANVPFAVVLFAVAAGSFYLMDAGVGAIG